MANATPSKTPMWTANNVNEVNKYGAPPNTSNRLPITQSSTISTQDYTGRASATLGVNAVSTKANPQPDANAVNDQASPLTISANALVIIIPPNAVTIRMMSTASFSFSETGTPGAALTQYYTQPAATAIVVDVSRIQQLLVTGSAPLSFFFQLI